MAVFLAITARQTLGIQPVSRSINDDPNSAVIALPIGDPDSNIWLPQEELRKFYIEKKIEANLHRRNSLKKFCIEVIEEVLHQGHKIVKEIHCTGHDIEEVSVRTNIYL